MRVFNEKSRNGKSSGSDASRIISVWLLPHALGSGGNLSLLNAFLIIGDAHTRCAHLRWPSPPFHYTPIPHGSRVYTGTGKEVKGSKCNNSHNYFGT